MQDPNSDSTDSEVESQQLENEETEETVHPKHVDKASDQSDPIEEKCDHLEFVKEKEEVFKMRSKMSDIRMKPFDGNVDFSMCKAKMKDTLVCEEWLLTISEQDMSDMKDMTFSVIILHSETCRRRCLANVSLQVS